MTPAEPSARTRITDWAPWIVLISGTLPVHVALPWTISLITRRYGWVEGRPGLWNLIGLIPVATGLVMIAWGGSLHIIQTNSSGGVRFAPCPSPSNIMIRLFGRAAWRSSTKPRYSAGGAGLGARRAMLTTIGVPLQVAATVLWAAISNTRVALTVA